jgi:hypothetical protein
MIRDDHNISGMIRDDHNIPGMIRDDHNMSWGGAIRGCIVIDLTLYFTMHALPYIRKTYVSNELHFDE